ncbi:component of the counting factor (CF) complex [Tieghemostelium lacteum]|uniref:Component of the counting factor (CF) complex n=1 Tax=Tieghemostelium lacteum TaxID=361077 RepID=A0A151ZJT9_TIELA|nr:component of the counting factor (CF) complex [Tieghemostelium lacteum]|eukprot:KYQ94169.1 component of the counting factor (CF) complex [Tieghemostelium lacteum]
MLINPTTSTTNHNDDYSLNYFLINSKSKEITDSNSNSTSSKSKFRFNFIDTKLNLSSTFCLILFIILYISSSANAQTFSTLYAADISDTLTVSDFQCVQNSSINYVIIECWKANGHPNPSCSSNIQAAITSQINSVDVYLEPCFECGQPTYQAAQMVNFISNFQININTAWIDVNMTEYWGNNTLYNRAFFEQLTFTISNRGVQVGIFSSQSSWNTIMGLAYVGGSSYPLWYSDMDDSPNFSDFTSFSGWTAPSMKQYKAATICSLATVNLDYSQTQNI